MGDVRKSPSVGDCDDPRSYNSLIEDMLTVMFSS